MTKLHDVKTDSLLVKVTVTPIGELPCMVTINKKVLFEDALTKTQVLAYNLPVNDALVIDIQIYRQPPHAVIIKVEVNGNNVVPQFQNRANPPTNYFDKTGIWSLRIPSSCL